MAKPALGRGLGALLGGANPAAKPLVSTAPISAPAAVPAGVPAPGDPASGSGERVQRIALASVHPCPFQPRKDFTTETLQELADSIREQGIIQPLIVRPRDQGPGDDKGHGNSFELIAGERRWRAAQLLGLKEVPVIVRQADDRAVLELALIENLQRENLNPIEEAQGYSELIAKFQLRQEDVAQKVGKSRVAVANALRLLKLDPDVQIFVRDSRLSVGHAKVLLSLALATQQKLAAEQILKQNLNVRQTEDLVSRLQKEPGLSTAGHRANGHAVPPIRDVHVANLESRLCERFGTKVHLRYRQGKGALEIRFFSDDELERILEIAGVKAD